VFGRIGYNTNASSEIWDKEFQIHFGAETGPILENALHRASRILSRIIAFSHPYGAFPMTTGWPEKQPLGDLPSFAKETLPPLSNRQQRRHDWRRWHRENHPMFSGKSCSVGHCWRHPSNRDDPVGNRYPTRMLLPRALGHAARKFKSGPARFPSLRRFSRCHWLVK
jgi:hypothetical protein